MCYLSPIVAALYCLLFGHLFVGLLRVKSSLETVVTHSNLYGWSHLKNPEREHTYSDVWRLHISWLIDVCVTKECYFGDVLSIQHKWFLLVLWSHLVTVYIHFKVLSIIIICTSTQKKINYQSHVSFYDEYCYYVLFWLL